MPGPYPLCYHTILYSSTIVKKRAYILQGESGWATLHLLGGPARVFRAGVEISESGWATLTCWEGRRGPIDRAQGGASLQSPARMETRVKRQHMQYVFVNQNLHFLTLSQHQ